MRTLLMVIGFLLATENGAANIILTSGTYKITGGDKMGGKCQQKIRTYYGGTTLQKIRADFLGSCSNLGRLNFPCKKDVCTARKSGTEIFEIKVTGSRSYSFTQKKSGAVSQLSYDPSPNPNPKPKPGGDFKGIAQNLSLRELTGKHKWRLCFAGSYANKANFKRRMVRCRSAKKLMLGCGPASPLSRAKLQIAAMGLSAKIGRPTPRGKTINENGSTYYLSRFGKTIVWGFANLGDQVRLQSPLFIDLGKTNPDKRMTWAFDTGGNPFSLGRCGKHMITTLNAKQFFQYLLGKK